VRLNHRHLRLRSPSKPRFPEKGFAAVMAALICFVLGSYLYFSPSFAAHFPVSCNLPSAPFLKDPAVATPIEPVAEKSAAAATGSQEIWDFSVKDDTLVSLLKENLADESGVPEVAKSMAAVVRKELNIPFDGNTELKEETRYNVTVDQDGRFLKATLELAPDKVFHCVRSNDGLRSWKEDVVLDYRIESIVFKMTGTLEESVLKAGEEKLLASELARVLWYDIDFQYESVRGDVCQVIFERRYADDRPSGYGEILCAVYKGRKTGTKTAVRFNGQYYDENGFELKKNFMRSPLKTLNVTSRWGMRFHPIRRVRRHHAGVDYGAPQGTPVRSVSRGVVTFAGWQNGYGNFVCIKHEDGHESRYGHLSRILVRKGAWIAQGKTIGNVGMTGDATGPHLHFELLAGKKHIDPQGKVKTSLRSVPKLLKDRFAVVAQPLLRSLDNVAATPAPSTRNNIRSDATPLSPRSHKPNDRDA